MSAWSKDRIVADAKEVAAVASNDWVGGCVALRGYVPGFVWAPILPWFGPKNYFLAVSRDEVVVLNVTSPGDTPKKVAWRDRVGDVVLSDKGRTLFWAKVTYASPSHPQEIRLHVHRRWWPELDVVFEAAMPA